MVAVSDILLWTLLGNYAANDSHNDELMIIHSDRAHGVGLVFPVLVVGHSVSRCHKIGRVICTG
jgi:hypothetical protein